MIGVSAEPGFIIRFQPDGQLLLEGLFLRIGFSLGFAVKGFFLRNAVGILVTKLDLKKPILPTGAPGRRFLFLRLGKRNDFG